MGCLQKSFHRQHILCSGENKHALSLFSTVCLHMAQNFKSWSCLTTKSAFAIMNQLNIVMVSHSIRSCVSPSFWSYRESSLRSLVLHFSSHINTRVWNLITWTFWNLNLIQNKISRNTKHFVSKIVQNKTAEQQSAREMSWNILGCRTNYIFHE